MQMIDQSVGGVAVVTATSQQTPAHQIRLLQQNKIPVVFCHRIVPGISAPSIIYKGTEVGLKAGKRVVETRASLDRLLVCSSIFDGI